MATWENATGHALSSPAWLETHHAAKLPERMQFARSLIKYHPRRLLDLGCGTGLWLDTLDKVLPDDCEFVGIDADPQALEHAHKRARRWDRNSEFLRCDLAENLTSLPSADMVLAFNMLPYLPNALEILEHLREKANRIIIRQYDGDTMRIGPMPSGDRYSIDSALHTALGKHGDPSHYDLDRAFQLIHASTLAIESLDFELTRRCAPFSLEFAAYLEETIEWMRMHLPGDARHLLDHISAKLGNDDPLYFTQVDLIAILATPTTAPIHRPAYHASRDAQIGR